MLLAASDVAGLLQCPCCGSSLRPVSAASPGRFPIICANERCALARDGFLEADGRPILVDFENSVLDRTSFSRRGGASTVKRDPMRSNLKSRILEKLFGRNVAAERIAERLVQDLHAKGSMPILLVIGGGEIGSGAESFYQAPDVGVIGTDIYVSPNTTLVADGHALPLKDGSVDAVWIQAVLEHVLDPAIVVSEIHRVLKQDGLVFADTPFMQQVHEGAYDFTRFTLSGHRWLFKSFSLIEAGCSAGPGTQLTWSIRYFFRALFRSDKLGTLAAIAFFWLRFFDRLTAGRMGADGASGVFFYGARSASSLNGRQAIAYYDEQASQLTSFPRARPR